MGGNVKDSNSRRYAIREEEKKRRREKKEKKRGRKEEFNTAHELKLVRKCIFCYGEG